MQDLAEQTILVTGATDGIGKQTAHDLARAGATVLLHGRNRARGEQTLKEIQEATGNDQLELFLADFVFLNEVRRLAESVQAKHDRLNVLINNAGIGAGRRGEMRRELSRDGLELRFGVNYLAPFLLTQLLLPSLRKAAPSRIVNVASAGQSPIDFGDVMLERRYDGLEAYCQSKLALIMFTFELAERLRGEHVTVNSLHPGSLLNTKMVQESFGRAWGTPQEGADAIAHLVTAPELDGITGQYFDQKREARAKAQAYDASARQRLWALSEELTGSRDAASA